MKQKNYNRIFKIVQSGFLLIFLLAGFFGMTSPLARAAGCQYGVTFNETNGSNGVTNATLDKTLSFVATVTESGDLASCQNQVGVTLLGQISSGDKVVTAQGENVTNGTAVITFPVVLSLNQSNFLNPNTAKIKARVYITNSDGNQVQVSESSYWTVNITGAPSGSGGETVSLNPTKGQFNIGDSVTISASVNSTLYSQIQSQGVQNVFFNILINGKGGYDETTVPVSNFAGQAAVEYGTIDITDANGFQNSANTITVELWSAGTKLKLASASTNLQAQGLAAATPPATPPGTPAAPAAPGSPGGVVPAPITPSGDCSGPSPDPRYCLYNPLPVSSLTDTLLLIMKGFLGIIGVWAVAFIVIGGFRLVVSAGNEEQVTAAKKTITWAIIGLVIALLSFSIIAIVQNILQTNIQNVNTKTSGIQINRKNPTL